MPGKNWHKKRNGRHALRHLVTHTYSAYLRRMPSSPYWNLTLWDYIAVMGELARRRE